MVGKYKHLVDVLTPMLKGTPSERVQTAEMVIERLQEEGVLVIGYGDKDIDQVASAFQEAFNTTKTSRYDRYAASRMVQQYGTPAVVGVIRLLASKQDERFSPTVNNLKQLEDKWPQVVKFLRKVGTNAEVIDA